MNFKLSRIGSFWTFNHASTKILYSNVQWLHYIKSQLLFHQKEIANPALLTNPDTLVLAKISKHFKTASIRKTKCIFRCEKSVSNIQVQNLKALYWWHPDKWSLTFLDWLQCYWLICVQSCMDTLRSNCIST